MPREFSEWGTGILGVCRGVLDTTKIVIQFLPFAVISMAISVHDVMYHLGRKNLIYVSNFLLVMAYGIIHQENLIVI